MSDIKPIQTYYKGYHFRSRLEARWAVFFDALGVKYEYEPEGFDLGDGIYYLPDFLLHNVMPRYAQGDYLTDIYVEVKGVPNERDAEKLYRFSKHYPLWVVGQIPDINYPVSCDIQRHEYCKQKYDFPNSCVFCPYDHGTVDGDECFSFSLGYDDSTLSFHGADSSYDYMAFYWEVENAFMKARQARFEHGETPTI